MADEPTIKFPEDFEMKESPEYNDLVPIYDTTTGKSKKTSLEKISNMVKGQFMGNALPATAPETATPELQIWYFAGPGTYANFPGADSNPIVLTENLNVISWDGTKATVQAVPSQDLSPYAKNGGSAKTIAQLDAEKLPADAIKGKILGNLANPANIENGSVDSAGNLGNTSGFKRIAIPFDRKDAFIVQGIHADSGKRSGFYSSLTSAGFLGFFPGGNTSVAAASIPDGTKYLVVTIKTNSEADDATAFPALMIYRGSTPLPYSAYTGEGVTDAVNDYAYEAKTLAPDNQVPNPVTDLNAVNLAFLKQYGLTIDSLTLTIGKNWFNPASLLIDTLLDSTGVVRYIAGSKWACIKIDISSWFTGENPETEILFGNISTILSGYYGFIDGDGNTLYFHGVINDGTMHTVAIPSVVTDAANAGKSIYFVWDVKTPDDESSVYDQAIICKGSAPIEIWEPYKVTITAIAGIEMQAGGGTAYDQPLNTTDNVRFNSIVVGRAVIGAAKWDVPRWDGVAPAPENLLIGETFYHTTNKYFTEREA